MKLEDVNIRITNIIKTLQMLGFKKQTIAMCLLESKSSPIDTINNGGKLQLSTINKVAQSMNRNVELFFPDADGTDPEAVDLLRRINEYNMKYFDSIISTVETYMKNNAGKNMKTGQVKKSKTQQDKDDLTKELMDLINESDF